MSLIDNTLRDPDIVTFIRGQASIIADLQAEVDGLEAKGGLKPLRRAKLLRREIKAAEAKIANARDIEARRDVLMGEGRDALLRAKLRGERVMVDEVETADFARDEHGARIINRRGPARGLPALVYGRSARVRVLTGIRHAFARGHLDNPRTKAGGDGLCQIGEAYEAMVAAAIPLKAVDWSQVGGAGFGPRGPQMAACEAARWLVIARGGGKNGVPLTPKQRHMVDAVCGEGCNVWQAAQKAKPKAISVPAAARALRGGLAQVAANIAAAREAKALVSGARIRAGREMDEAVRMAG